MKTKPFEKITNMKLEQIGSIQLIRNAYYLCHVPSLHCSGYVIAQAVIFVKSNPLKVVMLVLDNGMVVRNADILGLIRLKS